MIKGRVKKRWIHPIIIPYYFFETFPKGFFKIAKKKFRNSFYWEGQKSKET